MNTKFSTLLAACLMAGVLGGTTAYAADTTTAPEAAKTENVDKAAAFLFQHTYHRVQCEYYHGYP